MPRYLGADLWVLLALPTLLTWFAMDVRAAFPEKPVTLIVPFASGGASDQMARLVAAKLGEALGSQVVVENRAGSGGVLAAETVKKAAPDGYTLMFATTGTLVINPYIYRTLKYEPLRDFVPIGTVATTENVLVVGQGVAASSVKGLIDLARANPGKLTYASSGVGSSSHLAGALFASMAAVEIVHVPYRGSVPAQSDLLRGRVEMMFDTASTHMPNIKAGRVRALAVTGSRRMAQIPEVPTLAESGLPGYDISIWFGVVAPTGTPDGVVSRLESALAEILARPDTERAIHALDAKPLRMSSSEFAAFLLAERAKWKRTTAAAGSITLD